MVKHLDCPCGTVIEAIDDDALVEAALEHLADMHPELADSYTREQILFLAY